MRLIGVMTGADGADLHELEGKVVRLRFVMKDADLYSFVFKKSN